MFSGKIGQKNKQPLGLYEKTSASLLSSNMAKQTVLDTDGDGLRDWEEILWKTNPNNPDTDGDGYTDKEEISQGYDPLDPESNPETGKKAENQSVTREERKKIAEHLNLSEGIAKTMIAKIKDPSELTQSNPDNPFTLLDDETGQGMLGFIESFNIRLPENEIKTNNDNSKEAFQKYINERESIALSNPYPRLSEDEVFSQAITTNNFKKIDEFISFYDKAITNMKNIIAPSAFFEIHKRQTELFIATQEVYKNIKQINIDPLKTVLALQENQKIREEMMGLMIRAYEMAPEYYAQ